MVRMNFNAMTVEPEKSKYEVLPVGEYKVKIINTVQKPTRANPNNQYIQFDMEVLGGEYAGCALVDRLNIINGNPETVKKSMARLSAITRAAGKEKINDTAELHGKIVVVKVGVKKGEGDFGPSNSIWAYKKVGEPVTSAPENTMSTAQNTDDITADWV